MEPCVDAWGHSERERLRVDGEGEGQARVMTGTVPRRLIALMRQPEGLTENLNAEAAPEDGAASQTWLDGA
jgi:hypothetical protein